MIFNTPVYCAGYVAIFGSLIPAVSLSFSSEKSYSPRRLVCAHDIGECDEIAESNLSFWSGLSIPYDHVLRHFQRILRLLKTYRPNYPEVGNIGE